MKIKYSQEASGIFVILMFIGCAFTALGIMLIVINGFNASNLFSFIKVSLIAFLVFALAIWARCQSNRFTKRREYLIQNGIKCEGRVTQMYVYSIRHSNKDVKFHITYYSQILGKEFSVITPDICRNFDVDFETAKGLVCTVYETPIDKQNEDSVSNRISFIFNTEVTDLNPNRDADGVSYIVDSLDNAKPRPKVYGVLSKLCVVLWFALAAAVIYFANKFA